MNTALFRVRLFFPEAPSREYITEADKTNFMDDIKAELRATYGGELPVFQVGEAE